MKTRLISSVATRIARHGRGAAAIKDHKIHRIHPMDLSRGTGDAVRTKGDIG
jgi:hypothetical protein